MRQEMAWILEDLKDDVEELLVDFKGSGQRSV